MSVVATIRFDSMRLWLVVAAVVVILTWTLAQRARFLRNDANVADFGYQMVVLYLLSPSSATLVHLWQCC